MRAEYEFNLSSSHSRSVWFVVITVAFLLGGAGKHHIDARQQFIKTTINYQKKGVICSFEKCTVQFMDIFLRKFVLCWYMCEIKCTKTWGSCTFVRKFHQLEIPNMFPCYSLQSSNCTLYTKLQFDSN